MNRIRNAGALVVSVLLVAAVAAFGGQFAPGEWYRGLDKPFFTPPNWLFGPVWSLLYLAMATTAWLVWKERREAAIGIPLAVYGIHLLLNGLWSWLFFGLHWPGVAFGEIVLLAFTILAVILLFWRIRPLAGALLIPYLAWVSFAALLNLSLWFLNQGR